MQEKLKKIKQLNKKQIILYVIIALILASCIITITVPIVNQIRKSILSKHGLLEWEIVKRERYTAKIFIKVTSAEGIEQIEFPDGDILYCKNKNQVGIDYNIDAEKQYNFKIKQVGKDEVIETVYLEIPRIQGEYVLNNGVYAYKPDLTGYKPEYTRYLTYKKTENNDGNLNTTKKGSMTPSNWINSEEPENWYNLKNGEWANIYVENSGMETYYVWVPRYCFKLDQENQRSDVKFIDVYDNYKDENGNITPWKSKDGIIGLEEQGYQIPEAFLFDGKELPGFWSTKYTLGDITVPSIINYDLITTKELITIKNIKLNTAITNSNPIIKYTIALNGQIVKTIENQEELNNISEQIIDLSMGENIEKTINVTGLNENGEAVGSMTKKYEPAVVNKPDLEGFDKETTFYVTYDENKNEHSTIPISEPAPEDWYEYSFGQWANIVTRNNGLETYYTWVPRYEFTLDQTNQRSNVRFIKDKTVDATPGYQIPEAFTFGGEELTGFWSTKYTLGDEEKPRFDTEVVATSSSITAKGITGTEITRLKNLPDEEKINVIYNYYINGKYIGHKTTADEIYEYKNLEENTKYTIQIEIRDNNTNKYLGSIVKQITTTQVNKPMLLGFNTEEKDSEGNKLPVTYYCLYGEDGKETIGEKIKVDKNGNPTNMPIGWYDYSKSRWANIVVTDGNIENGEIKDATKTTYYTWVPRYEFKIDSSQYKQLEEGRTEVRFIENTQTEATPGYQIPEAFTFGGEELTGFWSTKYTLGE